MLRQRDSGRGDNYLENDRPVPRFAEYAAKLLGTRERSVYRLLALATATAPVLEALDARAITQTEAIRIAESVAGEQPDELDVLLAEKARGLSVGEEYLKVARALITAYQRAVKVGQRLDGIEVARLVHAFREARNVLMDQIKTVQAVLGDRMLGRTDQTDDES